MISALYVVFAVAHAAIWLWGVRAARRVAWPWPLTLVLVAAAPLWYENLRVGLGRAMGEGPLLYALSVPALAWHWTALPLFVVAAYGIVRGAGLPWARTPVAVGATVVVGGALVAIDLPYALGVLFGPLGPIPEVELRLGCIGDAIRYTASLSPAYFCGPEAEVHRVGPGPLVAIVMNVAVLGVGVALWAQRGWRWLALAAGAMFVAAAGGPAWGTYAPPVANVGEIGLVAALIATAARFPTAARSATAARAA
ncbi:MAG: hypothetical protein P1P87_09935 [Trueperaceae bacterium]|nr:hypothetical protein [Trueperaceae bacterium]